jgi:hypothetical protein
MVSGIASGKSMSITYPLDTSMLKSVKLSMQYLINFYHKSLLSHKIGGRKAVEYFLLASMPRGWGNEFFNLKIACQSAMV